MIKNYTSLWVHWYSSWRNLRLFYWANDRFGFGPFNEPEPCNWYPHPYPHLTPRRPPQHRTTARSSFPKRLLPSLLRRWRNPAACARNPGRETQFPAGRRRIPSSIGRPRASAACPVAGSGFPEWISVDPERKLRTTTREGWGLLLFYGSRCRSAKQWLYDGCMSYRQC